MSCVFQLGKKQASERARREPSLLRRPSFISLQIETQFSITTFVSSREKSERSMGTFFCRHHRTSPSAVRCRRVRPNSLRSPNVSRKRDVVVVSLSKTIHCTAITIMLMRLPPERRGHMFITDHRLTKQQSPRQKTPYRNPRI